VSFAERLLFAAPSLMAAIFAAFSPEISKLVAARVVGLVRESDDKVIDLPKRSPALSDKYLSDYLDYAIDAGQDHR